MADDLFAWRSKDAVEIILYRFGDIWVYTSTGWSILSNTDNTIETCQKLAELWKLKPDQESALFFAACVPQQDK